MPLQPLQLLVIAPDPREGYAIARCLRHDGGSARIAQVDSAAGGLSAASEVRFDCILLRANGLGSPGHELVSALRERRITTPIIVVDDEHTDIGERVYELVRKNQPNHTLDLTSPPETSNPLREVLSLLSHDLRGPLNSIGIAVEELADPSLTAPERTTYVAAIRRAVQRADRLIGDLLEAERMSSGLLELDTTRINVGSMLDSARAQHIPDATNAGVELLVEEHEPMFARGDAHRIHQVLRNLISNALRHTQTGGQITLAADQDEESIRISVTDTGCGIPPEELGRIFERFHLAKSRHRNGASFGLAIVDGIVRAHGGNVGVSSDVSQGSSFWFTLPRAGRGGSL